jgi:hypothetical protein
MPLRRHHPRRGGAGDHRHRRGAGGRARGEAAEVTQASAAVRFPPLVQSSHACGMRCYGQGPWNKSSVEAAGETQRSVARSYNFNQATVSRLAT